MTENLAHGYSSDSAQRELSYEYPHDLVRMISIFCILVNWTKVTSASEGLNKVSYMVITRYYINPSNFFI